VGKLQGKVAVITGATAGIGFAAADLFVKEGAYVFITGRRQKELDQAVKAIGKNVAGVQGDVANLADLDRLYDTIKATGRRIDVVFANAGLGEFLPLGQITEEFFDKLFNINVKGTLFTVQKSLPLFERRRLDYSHGLRRKRQRYDWLLGLRCNQGSHTEFRARMDGRTERPPHSLQRTEPGSDQYTAAGSAIRGRYRADRVDHSDRAYGYSRRDREGGAVPGLG
jgi:NAD(P)-dependent dehydrogenase (short-subunit alcohol dehydrogenase family)